MRSFVMWTAILVLSFYWIVTYTTSQNECERRGGVLVRGTGWNRYECVRRP